MPLHSVFSATSPSAQLIRTLFVWILILSAGTFAVVAGSVTLALIRFRARGSVLDPRQQYGVPWIEVVLTLVPLGLFVVVFVFTVKGDDERRAVAS